MMKYVNKYKDFNPINESFEEEKRNELLPDLVDILSDLVDDDFKIVMGSVNGTELTFNRYVEISSQADRDEFMSDFNPIYKAGNKIKSEFTLAVKMGKLDYDEFTQIVNEMGTVKSRLGDLGWELSKLKMSPFSQNFNFIIYTFTKPDIKTEDDVPTEKEIISTFDHFGLIVEPENVEYDGNICYVGAHMEYHDDIPEDVYDKLDRMLKMFGFDDYEADRNRTNDWLTVKFYVNPDVGTID